MRWGRLAIGNYRGVRVPRVLGLVLLATGAAWTLVDAVRGTAGTEGWGALAALSLVFAAGLIDDLVPIGPRGLRGHLRSLLEGHMTTGILKMLVITASAVIVVALLPTGGAWVRVSGVVLVAACANLWNGLDVRPGRALKASLLPGLPFVLWGDTADLPAVTGVVVAAVAVLPLDLRETAMLGDGGANLLGFAVGLGLYDLLAGAWVAIAAGVAVGLNVVAETVTLSRAIDAVPPLRWLDRVGRQGP